MSRLLYAGIDGGQSGTRAVIADHHGNVVGTGTGSPCDHLSGKDGHERNRVAIHGALGNALANAEAEPGEIVAVGMGLTSAPREINAHSTFEQILREIVRPRHTWIDHDAASNLAGASAGAPGVVVIAGSGSIAYGINAAGEEGRAGGLGYLMGDEGSAWWIGITALQAAAAAADGRGPQTSLLPFVLDYYELPTIRHLHTLLYAEEFRRTLVSGITRDVVGLAASDEVARGILHEAGARLASMVVATILQIHLPGEEVAVFPTGGVFRGGVVIDGPFSSALHASWPTAKIMQPRFEPVYGALIRGYQQAGVALSPALLERLESIEL